MTFYHVFEVVLEEVIEPDRLGRGMESRVQSRNFGEREREREVGSEIFLCILQPH